MSCDVLGDLVPFVQFKKREKHPCRSVALVKLQTEACNFTNSNIPPWVFSCFLDCTMGTKSRNASHILIVLNLAYNKNKLCKKAQTIDPEINSISTFQKRVWEQFLHLILRIIFQVSSFSCYIFITDQITQPY